MPFIEPVPEADAPPAQAALYAAARGGDGHVPNFVAAFSHRPQVYAAWRALNEAIRDGMELRRYELATLAAARRLRSSYCSLSHGGVLVDRFLAPEVLRALLTDPASAGLDEVDVAVMELADKVAHDATSVTQGDVERLRALGLSDADVFDVVVAAAARCFFSTALDALGTQPDAHFATRFEPALRDALTVGRPIAEA